MYGEALDLEQGALGPGMDRDLGVEPLDGGDRECVDESDVRVLEAGAVDAESHVVELPGDFSAGQTARPRWWWLRRSAAVSTMLVAM